jgi:hypothetical protein
MQSWSVLASHRQNLTVNTMTAPFYRIVWWLAIAFFVSFSWLSVLDEVSPELAATSVIWWRPMSGYKTKFGITDSSRRYEDESSA